jgi:acetyltransferase-like isoleucine patch superfamily enzyme
MREIIGVTIAFLGLCLVGAEADDIRVQVFGNLVGAVGDGHCTCSVQHQRSKEMSDLHVGLNCIIGDGVEFGECVTLGEGVVIGDGAQIGKDAYICDGVRIAAGITVGPGAWICPGAIVEADVLPGATVSAVKGGSDA